METNTLDYFLAAILLVMTGEKEVYLVAFHFCIFKAIKLNYDTYDKELLVVFEAFYTWCHYLEELKLLTDVITVHKNLEYFSTTKILSHYQAKQLEFLFQFNLVIHFHPEHLESKPDNITQRENLYLKERSAAYSSVNPQNLYPVFIHSQLVIFLQATTLIFLSLCTATIIDFGSLYNDILLAIAQDKTLQEHFHYPTKCQLLDTSKLLKNRRIYMPLTNNLCTYILQYHHYHIFTGYFGQNKTLKLICYGYTWPSICADVKSFYNSCITYMRSKPQYHKFYRSLKQLSIPE